MHTKEIDSYFLTLSQTLNKPTRIILIGGAASLIMGGVRSTRDVDYEIQTKESAEVIQRGILKSEKKSGLASEYSTDIERWSMLNMPGYRKKITLYKKFNHVSVYVLKPEYWSIGKIGRYLDSDIQDMIAVFTKQKTKPESLIKVWKEVLKKSPLSDELFHFKKHIEHFFNTFGPKLWNKKFTKIE